MLLVEASICFERRKRRLNYRNSQTQQVSLQVGPCSICQCLLVMLQTQVLTGDALNLVHGECSKLKVCPVRERERERERECARERERERESLLETILHTALIRNNTPYRFYRQRYSIPVLLSTILHSGTASNTIASTETRVPKASNYLSPSSSTWLTP